MRRLRLHWFVLGGCLLSALHGCGKSSPPRGESPDAAGQSAQAGDAAAGAHEGGDGGRGGSTAGAQGGSSGSVAGSGAYSGTGAAGNPGVGGATSAGTSGSSGSGGVGAMSGGVSGEGGLGAGAGRGGTAPVSGAGGDGGSAGAPIVAPPNWLCESSRYGDGVCDCGCALVDIDCPSESADECEACSYVGCADEACTVLFPNDNSICTTVPWVWSCSDRLYNDGAQCDCGCGFRDPDCAENVLAECDKCNGVGSCSGQACPGIINPSSAERCDRPPAPEGWTCHENDYGNGFECNCGCGVPDLDCRTSSADSCERCHCSSSRCPDSLDPADPTKCGPPPEDWLCPPEAWMDLVCDCGCGIPDHACGYHTPLYCVNCVGCTEGDCERLDPDDNSQCLP
jgi:hypothetical protein